MKSRLGDFQGALADADNIVEVQHKRVDFEAREDLAFDLQIRGYLKLKKGHLQGALADLDEGSVVMTMKF